MADHHCSFCGKNQNQVKNLIAGGGTNRPYICGECVALCSQIIANPPSAPRSTTTRPPERSARRPRFRWPLFATLLR